MRAQLDQVQLAFAPIAVRRYPDAGNILVGVKQILVMIEIAVALQQAETPEIVRRENLVAQRRAVDQRTPHLFSAFQMQQQAVAVVDFRAVIVKLPFRRAPNQYMLVSGANPMVASGLRCGSAARIVRLVAEIQNRLHFRHRRRARDESETRRPRCN